LEASTNHLTELVPPNEVCGFVEANKFRSNDDAVRNVDSMMQFALSMNDEFIFSTGKAITRNAE
jgi:hypothetical protein